MKNKWKGLLLALLSFMLPVGASAEESAWQWGVPMYQEIKPEMTHDGPTLLFSDSPEMVKKTGIMYRDILEGPSRLFFHHVNDTKTNKRLAVFLRRTTLRPGEVTLGKYGISRPNGDWLEAGKEAEARYYSSVPNGRHFLLTGPQDLLNGGKGLILRPQDLVTGIVDINFEKPVEISVMMLPVKTDPRIAAEVYGILPADVGGHVLRGTFPNANVHVTLAEPLDSDAPFVYGIELADDKKDPYVRGVDKTTGQDVVNYGNYGVMYDVNFTTKGKNPVEMRFNPFGGPYAGEGVLNVQGETAQYIPIPRNSQSFGWNHDGETMVLGTIPGGKSGTFYFTPPGSSNLPVRLFWEGKQKKEVQGSTDSQKPVSLKELLAQRRAARQQKEKANK